MVATRTINRIAALKGGHQKILYFWVLRLVAGERNHLYRTFFKYPP